MKPGRVADLAVREALRPQHQAADLLRLEPAQRLGALAEPLVALGLVVRGGRRGAALDRLAVAGDRREALALAAQRERLVLDHGLEPRHELVLARGRRLRQQDLERRAGRRPRRPRGWPRSGARSRGSGRRGARAARGPPRRSRPARAACAARASAPFGEGCSTGSPLSATRKGRKLRPFRRAAGGDSLAAVRRAPPCVAVVLAIAGQPARPKRGAAAPDVPTAQGRALALDAPRPLQHRSQPDPRPLPPRRPALGVRDRQGRLQHPDRRPRTRPSTPARPTPASTRIRNGRRRWRFKTGEIIDSAGVLGRGGTVTFGSGDERIYRLRSRDRSQLWRFRATRKPAQGQLVNWWEGNVTMGPGGVLYAGNTGGAEYALNPNGRLRWLHPTGNSVWSNAAIGEDGSVYFGSLDLSIYARRRARAAQVEARHARVRHLVAGDRPERHGLHRLVRRRAARARPAHRRGPLVVHHRRPRLRLARRSARAASTSRPPTGRSTPSTCAATCAGATTPATRCARRRCSAARRSGNGRILYVGSANGELYALDARTGRRRWSFDTTPRDPVLRDRNDLNSSPALGRRGVYIGGEHGRIVFVPYDWCLRRAATRAATAARGEAFGGSLTRMAYVTPGGTHPAGRARAGRCPPPPRSPRACSCARWARPWTPA